MGQLQFQLPPVKMGCVSILLLMKSHFVVLPQLTSISQHQLLMFLEMGQHPTHLFFKVNNIQYYYASIECMLAPNTHTYIHAGNRNTVFNVTFNLSSNSIICTFIKSADMKSCRIEYGSKEDDCSTFTLTSKDTNNIIVLIDLPSHFLLKGHCFRVKGCDGTHAAFVEGTYNPGDISYVTNT